MGSRAAPAHVATMSRESDKNMTFDEKCAQRKYMCDALIGNATPKVSFPRTPDLPDDLHGPMGYVPPRAPSQDIDAQKEMGMRNMRKYPKVVAEAMMDAEYEDSQLTEEERAARDPTPSENAIDLFPETKGALYVKRRKQYDWAVKQSHDKQVILMIGQTWSFWYAVPWYDELAQEEGLPSLLVKAELDSATTEFLKDMYETTCIPSFYILKDGKLHVTIEHEEVDVVQAWARAGKEPEGWPEAFGYGKDGDALEDPNAPEEDEFPCVYHVGYTDPYQHIIGD